MGLIIFVRGVEGFNFMIYISLINNIALLIAISILYSFILRKWYYETKVHQIISGFLFGAVTIIGMLNPFVWTNGIIFDGRSIIISVAGFFAGPLTAIITASIASIFRIYLGGSGVYMGVTVIWGSAIIGIIFHSLRIKNEKYNKPLYMYLFGLLVHIYMLIATIALPSKFTVEALYLISIPVLLLYPIGSLLVCILFQDLISKIQTEIALKKSEANYRELVEDVNNLILRLDSDFNIKFANNFAIRILANKYGEIIGKNFIKDILKKDANEIHTFINELFSVKDNIPTYESEIFDDEHCWISWSFNPIYNEKGILQEVLCVGTDITERKRAEEEKLKLQHLESLGVLAGGVAHDFNNILTVIMGKASLALIKTTDEKIKPMLNSIADATGRAKGLTQQLLTFAKGGTPEKKLIDLNHLLKEVVGFSISGSNVKTIYNLNHKFAIEADYSQLSQVIQNLAINAVQAMPDGGNLTILTEDIESNDLHFVKIIFKDEGCGIPEEYLNKIFNPYFTTKSSGSGLGLSVCHSIIKRHGGKISVNSILNKGTTFEIILPAKGITDNIQVKSEEILKKLKILVVDDEEEILEALSALLSYLGHEVHISKKSEEAIDLIQQHINNSHFDLSILDYNIKGDKNGFDLALELKQIDPNLKIIISSGYINDVIRNFIKKESFEILEKPYTLEKLKKLLASLFNK